ncbi:MAG: alpha/beta fold hydrolase [Spirosomataceae bacterium]
METIAINSDLTGKVYRSTTLSSKVVLICSATGVKQQYYEAFSIWLSTQGYTAITFDYQGFGLSLNGSINASKVTALQTGQHDLETVIQYIQREFRPQHLFLIGHSIGGQIIGLPASAPDISGVLLVAAQSGYWRLWPLRSQPRMWLTWHVLMPLLVRLFGYFPGNFFNMENLPKGFALEWAKWCRSPRYLFDHVPHATESFARIKTRLVSYSFSDDNYAPQAAVDWLTQQYTNAIVTRKHLRLQEVGLTKIGHFGIFREKCADSLWVDFVAEMEKMTNTP